MVTTNGVCVKSAATGSRNHSESESVVYESGSGASATVENGKTVDNSMVTLLNAVHMLHSA